MQAWFGDSVTINVASWTFGFLCPILLLSDLIASFGWTVFDRMTSEISRLSAMSSRLEDVALSICSSRAELDANQPAIIANSVARYLVSQKGQTRSSRS